MGRPGSGYYCAPGSDLSRFSFLVVYSLLFRPGPGPGGSRAGPGRCWLWLLVPQVQRVAGRRAARAGGAGKKFGNVLAKRPLRVKLVSYSATVHVPSRCVARWAWGHGSRSGSAPPAGGGGHQWHDRQSVAHRPGATASRCAPMAPLACVVATSRIYHWPPAWTDEDMTPPLRWPKSSHPQETQRPARATRAGRQ